MVYHRHLIIGLGEVGKALWSILEDHYLVGVVDTGKIEEPIDDPDIMHICFPCKDQKEFINEVRKYQKIHKPKFTVIHSTVPVGTSRKCNAIHSPIRGVHPDLVKGIKTFVKFIGGEQASGVADSFRRCGLRVCLYDKAETTELGKLLDTEYYRHCIEFAHKAKRLSEAFGVPFHESYTLFNETYNEGYTKLDHPEFVRPVLQPIMTPIGGHCVSQNKVLLETSISDEPKIKRSH